MAGKPNYLFSQEQYKNPVNENNQQLSERSFQNQQYTEELKPQGKRRFVLPEPEISQHHMLTLPEDKHSPRFQEYASLDYSRNLCTDDIPGAKHGTLLSLIHI
eukprot:TRINITY_DN38451_c0_g1_i1.p3 TRINITY_DN38451_c0_g1~~TRINITY_DN38451_c0_g1_i1.p3  ORF type:complete len:103 (-),score=19.12 TRINITY_DN38451_c0_g1_i1:122-430(-)